MPITDSEKTRRRALLKIHYDVENGHDMNGITTKSSSRDACAANMSGNSKALKLRAATSNCRSSPFITSTGPTNSSPNA